MTPEKINQNLPDIRNQLSSKDLFAAFKTQLAKDFQQGSLSSDFVEKLEPDYSIIHQKLISELQQIEKTGNKNLMKLLNRVDISEAQLKRYLNANKGGDYFNVIAELIIKRVLQKVVIRQHYKSHP